MKIFLGKFGVFIVALLISLQLTISASAATLLVDSGGQLTGATEVDVDGSLYDVSFVEGSCIAVFDGCDEVSDFVFQSLASAQAASFALLTQVFFDGPQGNFDTTPGATFGCDNLVSLCQVWTNYAPAPFGTFSAVIASNKVAVDDVSFNHGVLDGIANGGALIELNTALYAANVWAVWEPVLTAPVEPPISPVPLPASLPMLGFALAGLTGMVGRARKRHN